MYTCYIHIYIYIYIYTHTCVICVTYIYIYISITWKWVAVSAGNVPCKGPHHPRLDPPRLGQALLWHAGMLYMSTVGLGLGRQRI